MTGGRHLSTSTVGGHSLVKSDNEDEATGDNDNDHEHDDMDDDDHGDEHDQLGCATTFVDMDLDTCADQRSNNNNNNNNSRSNCGNESLSIIEEGCVTASSMLPAAAVVVDALSVNTVASSSRVWSAGSATLSTNASGNAAAMSPTTRLLLDDFVRQGLLQSVQQQQQQQQATSSPPPAFRVCTLNKRYELCKTYPSVFLVPRLVSDECVRKR